MEAMEMETLYVKLYDKYSKLKKGKESAMDELNRDQEQKFLDCIVAADEMIEHLKSENEKLHGEVDELKSELASIRSFTEEEQIQFQKLLEEEKQKNMDLSGEIARLQQLEQNDFSLSSVHEKTRGGQENEDTPQNDFSLSSVHEKTRGGQENEDTPPEGEPRTYVTRLRQKRKPSHDTEGHGAELRESILKSTKKQKTAQGTEAPATTIVSDELDHSVEQCVYGMKGSNASDIQQSACCHRKISNSDRDSRDTGPVNCIFQYLVEVLVGMQIEPLPPSNEPCVLVQHLSSGYSFNLKWITNSQGETEFAYHVLSLGTLDAVATEWMRETIIFHANQCSTFFERVCRVIKS